MDRERNEVVIQALRKNKALQNIVKNNEFAEKHKTSKINFECVNYSLLFTFMYYL